MTKMFRVAILAIAILTCYSVNLMAQTTPGGAAPPAFPAPSILSPSPVTSPSPFPTLNINFGNSTETGRVSLGLKLLSLLTILALVPSFLVMATSFTRIIVVLSFVRRALSIQEVPPTQVLLGLSLFLTFFIMAPTFTKINNDAIQPYLRQELGGMDALKLAERPMRDFMFAQTRKDDLALFMNIGKLPKPSVKGDIPTYVLIPSFIISELKTAFIIGFVIYIPFLVLDMVIASILLSMGMFMLPPVLISLPFKLILFVLVDGWSLIVTSLIRSYF